MSNQKSNQTLSSLPNFEIIVSLHAKGYDMTPLLDHCFNRFADPEVFAESLQLCYLELADYIMRDHDYDPNQNLPEHMYMFRLLFESLKKCRQIPPSLP